MRRQPRLMQQAAELDHADGDRGSRSRRHFHGVSLGCQIAPDRSHQGFEPCVPPCGEEREVQVLRVPREPVQEPQSRTADERPVGECPVVLQGKQDSGLQVLAGGAPSLEGVRLVREQVHEQRLHASTLSSSQRSSSNRTARSTLRDPTRWTVRCRLSRSNDSEGSARSSRR